MLFRITYTNNEVARNNIWTFKGIASCIEEKKGGHTHQDPLNSDEIKDAAYAPNEFRIGPSHNIFSATVVKCKVIAKKANTTDEAYMYQ